MRTILGFGVGYVLGARAGRHRYEQMKAWWLGVVESEGVRALGRRIGGDGIGAARDTAASGLSAASEQLRKLAD
ncbi:MAG: YtxH domain-containing protein [Acidimicrobiia bacterium]